jgi:sec-independent protein translocase protein TatA
MIGSLGLLEVLGIVLVILLLFGAKRIPAVGRGLGQGITNFLHAVRGGPESHGDLANPSRRRKEDVPRP